MNSGQVTLVAASTAHIGQVLRVVSPKSDGMFALVQGKSPLDIEAYRQKAEPLAIAGGLLSATAYSAVEQAL